MNERKAAGRDQDGRILSSQSLKENFRFVVTG
jgi:hypothetical protein